MSYFEDFEENKIGDIDIGCSNQYQYKFQTANDIWITKDNKKIKIK